MVDPPRATVAPAGPAEGDPAAVPRRAARPWSGAAHVVLLALAVAVCYARTLHAPFVFDDDPSILVNPAIGTWAADEQFEPPTRRVAYLTLKLNHALGGIDPFGYHLFNVVVHVLAACAVYALARTLLRHVTPGDGDPRRDRAAWAAFAGALVFAAHPVQTQAVTYVVQRIASLATLFYAAALALYAWSRTREGGRGARAAYVAALLSAVLAMRTKEISATLPLALVAVELVFLGGPRRGRILAAAPFVALLPLVPLQVLRAERMAGSLVSGLGDAAGLLETPSRADYVATQATVVTRYLRLVVLPTGQNLDYDFPIARGFTSPAVLLGAALVAACLAAGFVLVRRTEVGARLAGFGVLLFFLGLSVESTVIPIVDVIFEHRLYLPFVGFALVVAGATDVAMERFPGARRWMAATVAAWVVALGAATVARNATWRDSVTLWTDVVAKSPSKARVHYNLGNAFHDQGRLDEAERSWLNAVRLEPRYSYPQNQLGNVAFTRKRLDVAEERYRLAIAGTPVNPDAYYNLAQILDHTDRAAEALPLYRRFFDLNPPGRARQLAVLRERFGWR